MKPIFYNPGRILLAGLLLLGCLSGARANIGETFSQISTRYGPAKFKVSSDPDGPPMIVYRYEFNNRHIFVGFLDGKSCSEAVRAPEGSPSFSEQVCLAIATAISGKTNWTEMSRDESGVLWTASETTAALRHFPGHPDFLFVDSMKLTARILQKAMAEEEAKQPGAENKQTINSSRHSKERVVALLDQNVTFEQVPDKSFTVSADGRHFGFRMVLFKDEAQAALQRLNESGGAGAEVQIQSLTAILTNWSGDAEQVIADGMPGKYYPNVDNKLVFSPDSQHLAYVAGDTNQEWVVVDGIEQPQKFSGIRELTYSSTGNVLAYIGWHRGDGHKEPDSEAVVVNGEEQKSFQAILDTAVSRHAIFKKADPEDDSMPCLLFSPKGDRLAYAAFDGTNYFVIIDGKTRGPYSELADNSLIFSPDGKRFAFGAHHAKHPVLVVDGKEQPGVVVKGKNHFTIRFGSVVFSPDGERMGYVEGIPGNHERVVIGGKEEKSYPRIMGGLAFSPDGKRVAYRALAPGKNDFGSELMVVDGKESKAGEGDKRGFWFSPDSQRFAYLMTDGRQYRLVVDDKAGAPFPDISSFCFSPDSQRYGYLAGSSAVVVDGDRHTADGVEKIFQFTPDSKHFVYITKSITTGTSVMVDGRPGRYYSYIYPDEHPVIGFGPSNQLCYYGRREKDIYLDEETLGDTDNP